MKISKVAEREQKHVYGIAYIPDEDINLKHRHKLNVTERVHCANVTNQSSCEIKPEIKIVTKNKTKTMETAEGFEIRILKYANVSFKFSLFSFYIDKKEFHLLR